MRLREIFKSRGKSSDTSQPRRNYVYKPLGQGEIRVLSSTIKNNVTVWTLKTINLYARRSSTGAAYDALSYTWGDLSCTYPFVCSGGYIQIHKNLHDALPYIAGRKSSRPIWIDALCINQADEREKFAQIRIMPRIYQQATQVFVWLGLGVQHSKEAIGLLPRIAQFGRELERWEARQRPPTFESRGLPPLTAPVWEAIYYLFNNTWFRRLWTLQEAVLANQIRVLQGWDEIDWELLGEAVDHACNLEFVSQDAEFAKQCEGFILSNNVFMLRQAQRNPTLQRAWPDHLMRVIGISILSHHCRDPRDRVFAILGFVDEDEIEQIGIRDHLSLDDLYIKFTHFLFSNIDPNKKNWWHLLEYATAGDKRPGLPSWCPDYHAASFSKYEALDRVPVLYGVPCPYAAFTTYPTFRFGSYPRQNDDSRILRVYGRHFDTVARVFPTVPYSLQRMADAISTKDYIDMMLDTRRWEREIAVDFFGEGTLSTLPDDPNSVWGVGEARISLDDYWRVYTGNILWRRESVVSYETFRTFRSKLDRYATIMDSSSPELKSKLMNQRADGTVDENGIDRTEPEILELFGTSKPWTALMNDIRPFAEGRRLFRTAKGRFGIGPATVQVEDVVSVLNCAIMPYVLRKYIAGQDTGYTHVGKAYVHGMMNGEIEQLHLQTQDISLF